MRIQEKFASGRVISYCLMDNYIHLLLEVQPMADEGLSEDARRSFRDRRNALESS